MADDRTARNAFARERADRTLLLSCLGPLNSTEFEDSREPIRQTTVTRLERRLGYQSPNEEDTRC